MPLKRSDSLGTQPEASSSRVVTKEDRAFCVPAAGDDSTKREKFSFVEFRGKGVPAPDIGLTGDIYIDLTPGMHNLYARFPDEWKRWTGPGQRKNPMSHPICPGHFLWCSWKKKSFGWFPDSKISRIIGCSTASEAISKILMAQANSEKRETLGKKRKLSTSRAEEDCTLKKAKLQGSSPVPTPPELPIDCISATDHSKDPSAPDFYPSSPPITPARCPPHSSFEGPAPLHASQLSNPLPRSSPMNNPRQSPEEGDVYLPFTPSSPNSLFTPVEHRSRSITPLHAKLAPKRAPSLSIGPTPPLCDANVFRTQTEVQQRPPVIDTSTNGEKFGDVQISDINVQDILDEVRRLREENKRLRQLLSLTDVNKNVSENPLHVGPEKSTFVPLIMQDPNAGASARKPASGPVHRGLEDVDSSNLQSMIDAPSDSALVQSSLPIIGIGQTATIKTEPTEDDISVQQPQFSTSTKTPSPMFVEVIDLTMDDDNVDMESNEPASTTPLTSETEALPGGTKTVVGAIEENAISRSSPVDGERPRGIDPDATTPSVVMTDVEVNPQTYRALGSPTRDARDDVGDDLDNDEDGPAIDQASDELYLDEGEISASCDLAVLAAGVDPEMETHSEQNPLLPLTSDATAVSITASSAGKLIHNDGSGAATRPHEPPEIDARKPGLMEPVRLMVKEEVEDSTLGAKALMLHRLDESHLGVIYHISRTGEMFCRLCLQREPMRILKFPPKTPAQQLASHSQDEHHNECAHLVRMSPGEVRELSRVVNFTKQGFA